MKFKISFGKFLWFIFSLRLVNPAKICLLKVNNRNTRKRCKICSKLTIKRPEWCQWRLIYQTLRYKFDFQEKNGSVKWCTVWKESVLELFWSVFSLIWIRRDTGNAGKYGPEKLQIRTFFTQWQCFEFWSRKNFESGKWSMIWPPLLRDMVHINTRNFANNQSVPFWSVGYTISHTTH